MKYIIFALCLFMAWGIFALGQHVDSLQAENGLRNLQQVLEYYKIDYGVYPDSLDMESAWQLCDPDGTPYYLREVKLAYFYYGPFRYKDKAVDYLIIATDSTGQRYNIAPESFCKLKTK